LAFWTKNIEKSRLATAQVKQECKEGSGVFPEVGMEITFATKQKDYTLGNHVIKGRHFGHYVLFC
jgi:hypothetical protein